MSDGELGRAATFTADPEMRLRVGNPGAIDGDSRSLFSLLHTRGFSSLLAGAFGIRSSPRITSITMNR